MMPSSELKMQRNDEITATLAWKSAKLKGAMPLMYWQCLCPYRDEKAMVLIFCLVKVFYELPFEPNANG